MELVLIAAVARGGVIGLNGKMPWKNLPGDMAHFKELTMGHPVIMGRKTYESIPEKFRPLPGRTNIVVSKRNDLHYPENVKVCDSVDAAIDFASGLDEIVLVTGGQKVYEQTIDRAKRLEITEINAQYPGDAHFPKINPDIWVETGRDTTEDDSYAFVSYGRRQ